MSAQHRPVQNFDIEGPEVKCYMRGGDRLWYCPCAHFERTLTQYGEGFCPHTAAAIMGALEDGPLASSP
jgi:hypothetical protein